MGTKEENRVLYPQALKEFRRVIAPSGRLSSWTWDKFGVVQKSVTAAKGSLICAHVLSFTHRVKTFHRALCSSDESSFAEVVFCSHPWKIEKSY